MSKNIFFVGGIHGVGKTTFCNSTSNQYNIEHFSASNLIANYKNRPFKSLFVDEIEKNQDILVTVTKNLFNPNKMYLLDGHFYLLNKHKQPEKIPKSTFINLGIKKILILTEDVNIIFTRLKSRNNYSYDLNMLNELQNKEIEYSREISSILGVPYKCINLSTIDKLSLNAEIKDFLS